MTSLTKASYVGDRTTGRRWRAIALAVVLAVVATGCATFPNKGPGLTGPRPGLLQSTDQADFSAKFGTTAAVAISDLGGATIVRAGDTRAPYAWSNSKVLIVAQTLLDVGGPSKLTSTQRSKITAALTASDNDAAKYLYDQLVARHGGVTATAAVLTRLLRRAGDSTTNVSTVGRSTFTTHGQTLWPVEMQAQFLSSLGRNCLLDATSTNYLINQMSNSIPSQRFGLGTIGALAYKGGWGPDPNGAYLVRQMGLVRTSSGNLATVAITARPTDGTFAGGQALLSRVSAWVQTHVGPASAPVPCPKPVP